MKRIATITIAVMTVTSGAGARAATPEEIYRQFSGALAVVQFSMETGGGLQDAIGTGLCVHSDKQGRAIFMTTAISLQTRVRDMSKLHVRSGGIDGKSVAAEIMGSDPVSGLAFIRTTAAVKWPAVTFVGRTSGIKIGQQVVSIGLFGADGGHEPCLGVAYISGKVRVPETLYRVTGGKLTGTCSPVFNLDGKVVGLVTRQLPMAFQMMTSRGQTVVGLTGRDEKSYFLPIDEFADTIANMPSPKAPRRRVWTGVLEYHPVTKDAAVTYGVDSPAIMLGKVIKGTPAEKAGLKERDLIIALNGKQLEKLPNPSMVAQNFLKQLQRLGLGGGKKVSLTVKRGSKQLSVDIELVPVPRQPYEADRYISKQLALAVREKVPTDAYVDKNPTADVKGLIVLNAPARGPAGAAGVKRGDLLIEVNGKPVTTAAQVRDIIGKAIKDSPDKTIALVVQRGDKTYPISIIRSQK